MERCRHHVARVSILDPDEERMGGKAGGVVLSLQGSKDAFSLRPLVGDGGVSFLCIEGPSGPGVPHSLQALIGGR